MVQGKPRTLDDLKALSASHGLAVFGAGVNGRRVFGALRGAGLQPACFLDNFRTGVEEKTGLPIHTPPDYVRGNPGCVVLLGVASEKSLAEALSQMHGLGVDPARVLRFEEIVEIFEGAEITWADSRELEFDFHANDRVIERMAGWIGSDDTSVADLGCAGQHLRTLLGPHCRYVPVDYVSRSPDTIVCDFNAGALPHLPVDVMFACVVLSCVKDLERFLCWVCDNAAKKVIIRNKVNNKITAVTKFSGYPSAPSIGDVERIVNAQGFDVLHKEIDLTEEGVEYASVCFGRIAAARDDRSSGNFGKGR